MSGRQLVWVAGLLLALSLVSGCTKPLRIYTVEGDAEALARALPSLVEFSLEQRQAFLQQARAGRHSSALRQGNHCLVHLNTAGLGHAGASLHGGAFGSREWRTFVWSHEQAHCWLPAVTAPPVTPEQAARIRDLRLSGFTPARVRNDFVMLAREMEADLAALLILANGDREALLKWSAKVRFMRAYQLRVNRSERHYTNRAIDYLLQIGGMPARPLSRREVKAWSTKIRQLVLPSLDVYIDHIISTIPSLPAQLGSPQAVHWRQAWRLEQRTLGL